ncbi:Alpha/Beta hydrolase protein [Chaetomium fimeti]|uniref:Kynurenine formamidase n=1 Tax=Chaetomium fimeti TaxID=1854472 RepID=A0AAE0HBI7_9PEZI|nr:Alpha/Beta hydrolase protein [Chaetomium fimeti]
MQSRAGKTENTTADWSAWASVPWSPVGVGDSPNNNNTNTPIGWLKSGIPYLPQEDAVALQTLDVWIPANTSSSSSTTTTTTTTPNQSSPPPNPPNKTWIVYIHGGAWRDPAITSTSFTAAATNLLLRAAGTTNADSTLSLSESGLAGLVSLNYRLSPHPSHPPSTPADKLSRSARHPEHVADVRAALAFLGRLGILGGGGSGGGNWVLAGHSCGATLAFQAVMHPRRWGLASRGEVASPGEGLPKPAVLVGFNGLYDLAGFIAAPPEGFGHLREGYREFVEGAFGADEGVWKNVCPATVEGNWVGEWIGDGHADGEGPGKTVVLVQSREDTLVPWDQLEAMRARLADEGRVGVKVMEATGKHDDVWREGGRMAEVLWNTLRGM